MLHILGILRLDQPHKSFSPSIPFTKKDVKNYFIKDFSMILNMMIKSYKKTFKSILQLLNNRKEDPELIKKFEHYVNNIFFDKFKTMFQDVSVKVGLILHSKDMSLFYLLQRSSKLVTMTHGDFWNNNMMFSESDGSPLAIKFLDFQVRIHLHTL